MSSLRRIVRAVTAVAVLALGAVTSWAADPVGPPIGNNRYRSTISDATDADSFIGRFFTGDVISVSVVADRPSRARPPELKPVLVLVDPRGVERFAGIIPSANGFALTLKRFTIDIPGIWAARVTGDNGTTGSFTISFRVKPIPKLVLKRQRLGDELPFSRTHEFSGFDGAKLNVILTYTRLSSDVEIRSLTDPSGAEVQAPDRDSQIPNATRNAVLGAVQKKHRVELKGVVLGKGSGTYKLRVRIPTAAATYNLSISLAGPPRPTGKSKAIHRLSAREPQLDPRSTPAAGEVGEIVQFTGLNFSTSPPPTVLFGTSRSKKVTTRDGGKAIDCVIPPRTGASVVAVYVINPDGQGAARDSYFAYIPPPKITDLLDAVTGLRVESSSAGGGRAVRLIGENFEPGQVVKVGPSLVTGVVIAAGGTELTFLLPVVPPGTHTVTVSDSFDRSAESDFSVFFKNPPKFATPAYSPGAIKVQTPTIVTIHGTNFEDTDQLVFNGQDFASTFVDSTQRTFILPALGVGGYPVALVDSIGTVVNGPTLSVKPAPTITAVSVVAGDVVQSTQIPSVGGSTVQVTGTDFLSDDTITVGGNAVTTIVSSTPTSKQFIAPAGAIGFATITITDGGGQSGSLANVLRYVGLKDTTTSRVPAKSSLDDFSAIAAVAGDLDRDGLADDVVLGSPFGNSPGTRKQLTRVLLGDASGLLVDTTATSIPAAFSDASKVDGWDARCIAIGDIDKANGDDIVIGGSVTLYGTNDKQIRLFKQGATAGTFTNDAANAPPLRTAPGMSAYYYNRKAGTYNRYTVYGAVTQKGTPQAIAIGDIDNDSVVDIVMGTDHFQYRQTYYDPAQLYSYYGYLRLYSLVPLNQTDYIPATRVYQNKIPSGLKTIDLSATKLPGAGSSKDKTGQPPALHCRDLALVDLDRNGTLDLVIAWDDPSTVTSDGLKSKESGTPATSPAAIATRVLLYGPAGTGGKFTDATATWMPAGSSPEFWQAKRMAFADLDADGDQDMVLVLDKGLDAWTGTETRTKRALRILRNDGGKFIDVSSTALPTVSALTTDDFRGSAVAIRDVDGDGVLDILISTTQQLKALDGTNVPRFRIFFGKGGLKYGLHYGFSESLTVDTGEADRLVYVGDLGGAGVPVLLMTSETPPATSPGGALSRTQEWKK